MCLVAAAKDAHHDCDDTRQMFNTNPGRRSGRRLVVACSAVVAGVLVLLHRGHAHLQVWQQRGDGAQRRLPYRLDAVLRQAVQLSQQCVRVRGELQQARQAAQQVCGQGATLRRWAANLRTTGCA